VLDELGSGRQLGPAARSALAAVAPVQRRPLPMLDAVIAWVVAESVRFQAAQPAPLSHLSTRVRDCALVALALAPAAALTLG
jgi:hypothetical protein